ncbi:hypothetical protein H2199_001227 [Coniosporium tulheliwenetii]|uniref:Uncharacterized protein n=1 Tax=Coniosporium tulheliwenetii TaxID=3383036 RepID=A0ACC2ZL96_9PEZI|nr:hypothetical protein H2199_001227 [Cladosporium sp. JES 115]
MDQLPLELLHWICNCFDDAEDVQNFRLVNKAFAAIGAEHLVRHVHFFLHEDSFKRLKAISEHPIISQHVVSLFYEADIYDDPMMGFVEWESHVDLRSRVDLGYVYVPDANNDERAKRHERRIVEKFNRTPRHQLSKAELRKHYRIYQSLWQQQKRLQDTDQDLAFITDAMKHFPRLRSVVMSSGFWYRTRSEAVKRAFKDSLCYLHGDGPYNSWTEGTRQLKVLLEAALLTDTKLEAVLAGSISWQFFRLDEDTMVKMISACASLTTLNLMLSTGQDEDGDELGVEASWCRDSMRSGVLRSFLESIPNLRHLDVSFDVSNGPDDCFPARLGDVIGDNYVWPNLKELVLGHLDDASETQILDILKRHRSSLRHFGIDTIALNPGNSWLSLLPKIRDVVQLESACICGSLSTVDAMGLPEEAWNITPLDVAARDEEREELENFILDGGECPLNLDNMDFR